MCFNSLTRWKNIWRSITNISFMAVSGSHRVAALFIPKLLWEWSCPNMSKGCARDPITTDALQGTTFINYLPITHEFNCSARSITPVFIRFYGTILVHTVLCGLSICSVGGNEINGSCMCHGLCLCVLSEMSVPPTWLAQQCAEVPKCCQICRFCYSFEQCLAPLPLFIYLFSYMQFVM